MKQICEIIIPLKFVMLISKTISASMVLDFKHENILKGTSYVQKTSNVYVLANRQIETAVILTIIISSIELLLLLQSKTLFQNQFNFVLILIHGLGTVSFCSFIIFQVHFQIVWVLFIFFSLFTLILELISIMHSQYKNLQ